MKIQNKLYESLNRTSQYAVRKCIEANVAYKKAQKLLEADQVNNAAQEIAVADDSLAQAGSVPNVSEEVVANIDALQSAVDNLKMSAGIQEEIDPLAGQAEEGIPPAQTATGTTMYESYKARTKARSMRESRRPEPAKKNKLYESLEAKRLQEKDCGVSTDFYKENTMDFTNCVTKPTYKDNKNNNDSQLKVPAVGTLKKGTDSKRVRFPQKTYNDLESRATSTTGKGRNIVYKRQGRSVGGDVKTVREGMDRATMRERQAVDKYLGKDSFSFNTLKEMGIVES